MHSEKEINDAFGSAVQTGFPSFSSMSPSGNEVLTDADLFSFISKAFDNCFEEIYWLDKEYRIVYANKSACKALGYSQEEISGMSISNILTLSDTMNVKLQLKAVCSGNSSLCYKVNHKCADGSSYPVKSNAKLMDYKGTEYICISSCNISERSNMIGSLMQSELEKDLILNAVKESLVYYDTHNTIIWASRQTANRLNVKQSDLIGKKCYKALYNRDAPCAECTVRKAIHSGKPVFEERQRENDGGYGMTSAYPVYDKNKKMLGVVESVIDVTERHAAEEKLRTRTREYHELIETMGMGFGLFKITKASDGTYNNFRVILLNPAFEMMTGIHEADALGRKFSDLFPKYAGTAEIQWLVDVGLTRESNEKTMYLPFVDKYFKMHAYSPKPDHFALMITDVTKIVHLEEESKKVMRQIEMNFEQLAILNDEIRNPLQIISGYSQLDSTEHSEKVLEQIDVIDKLVNQVDKRWLESEKIREYLKKHHDFSLKA